MTDFYLLSRLRAIDFNHNGIIDGPEEIRKARSLGVNALEGESIAKLAEKSSKANIQDLLKQIDQTQTVDNKHDPLKRKKFDALG